MPGHTRVRGRGPWEKARERFHCRHMVNQSQTLICCTFCAPEQSHDLRREHTSIWTSRPAISDWVSWHADTHAWRIPVGQYPGWAPHLCVHPCPADAGSGWPAQAAGPAHCSPDLTFGTAAACTRSQPGILHACEQACSGLAAIPSILSLAVATQTHPTCNSCSSSTCRWPIPTHHCCTAIGRRPCSAHLSPTCCCKPRTCPSS